MRAELATSQPPVAVEPFRSAPSNEAVVPIAVRTVELILPAHNEEEAVPGTVRGFLAAPTGGRFTLSVLVAEDGSADRTRQVVDQLSAETGGRVALTPVSERKGYSKALIDAVRLTHAEIIGFCDSDGQFDAADLGRLVDALKPGCVVAGRRTPRVDSRFRIVCSRAFGLAYRLLIGLSMEDPSSPFVVVRRDDLLSFLPEHAHLAYGFWWEFFARAQTAGFEIVEIPVSHHLRVDGKTQVYRLGKLPRIVATHLAGLIRLRRELAVRRAD